MICPTKFMSATNCSGIEIVAYGRYFTINFSFKKKKKSCRNFDHYSCPYLTYAIKRIYFIPVKLFVVHHVLMDIRCEPSTSHAICCPENPMWISAPANMQNRKFKQYDTLSMNVLCVQKVLSTFVFVDIKTNKHPNKHTHTNSERIESMREKKNNSLGHIFQKCFNNRTSVE